MDADYGVRRYAKPVVFLLCLLPVAWLAAGIYVLQSGDVFLTRLECEGWMRLAF